MGSLLQSHLEKYKLFQIEGLHVIEMNAPEAVQHAFYVTLITCIPRSSRRYVFVTHACNKQINSPLLHYVAKTLETRLGTDHRRWTRPNRHTIKVLENMSL